MAQETSASKTSDQMIRLNVFSFLGEKKCSSISQKKKKKKRKFHSNGKQSKSPQGRRILIKTLRKILCSARINKLVNHKTNLESLSDLISPREKTYALRAKDSLTMPNVNTTS